MLHDPVPARFVDRDVEEGGDAANLAGQIPLELREVHENALKALVGRTGKMARVVRGGTVRPGDPIELLEGPDAVDAS